MNPEQYEDFIREKVISNDPSIMELKFGTKVQDDEMEEIVRYLGQDYIVGSYLFFIPSICDTYSDDCIEKKEILGRDILAQDIQKIMPGNWMLKYDALGRYEFVDMTSFGTRKFKNEYIVWEDKPLKDQTEQTKVLISKILGME